MAFVEAECPTRRCHTLAVVVTPLQSQEVGEGITRLNKPVSHTWDDLERWQIEDGQARRCLPNLDTPHTAGVAAIRSGDDDGRLRLYADIAHPINASCRELIQSRVVREYEAELVRARQPGYMSRYDAIGDEERR
jgi:hypothetical protein